MAPIPWKSVLDYQLMLKFTAVIYFCLYYIFSYILYTIFFRLKKLNQNTFESTSTQVIVVSLYTYVIIYTYFVNKLFYSSIIICCAVFSLHSCSHMSGYFNRVVVLWLETFKTLLLLCVFEASFWLFLCLATIYSWSVMGGALGNILLFKLPRFNPSFDWPSTCSSKWLIWK